MIDGNAQKRQTAKDEHDCMSEANQSDLRRWLQLVLKNGYTARQLRVPERQTVHLLQLLPEPPVRLRQLLLYQTGRQ